MQGEQLKIVVRQVYEQVRPQVEAQLQQFQRDMVGWQGKIMMVWNTMNVVLHVLVKKGLITPEEFEAAGREVMIMSQENVTAVGKAASEQRRITPGELKESRMDWAERILNKVKADWTAFVAEHPADMSDFAEAAQIKAEGSGEGQADHPDANPNRGTGDQSN